MSSKEPISYPRVVFLSALILFLGYCGYHYQPYTFTEADAGWMAALSESIAFDLDFDMYNQLEGRPTKASDQTALGKGGQWYSVHEPLMSLLAAPLYSLIGVNACLILNIIVATLLVYFTFKLQVVLGFDEKKAAICTLLMAGFSHILNYSYYFSLDMFGALFVVLCVYFLISEKYKLSALFFSLGVFGRINIVILLPAIAIYFLLKPSARKGIIKNYAMVGLPFLLLWCWMNWVMFGHPLEPSYHHWQVLRDGVLVPGQGQGDFVFSFDRILRTTFSINDGYLLKSPLSILGLVFGVLPMFKKHRTVCLFLLSYFIFLTVYHSGMRIYIHSTHRYFLPVMALSTVFLTAAITSLWSFLEGFNLEKPRRP